MSDERPTDPDRSRYQRTSIFLLLTVITGLFLVVAHRFLIPLFLAAIFAGLLRPVYLRFEKWMGGRRSLASLTTIVITLIFVGAPVLTLLGIVVAQAVRVTETAVTWVERHTDPASIEGAKKDLIDHFPALKNVLPDQDHVMQSLAGAAEKLGGVLIQSLSSATSGAAGFLLGTFVMVYAMFFFLIDGPATIRRMVYYLPLRTEDKQAMLDRFLSVTRATLKGSLLIGLIQGFLGGIGFHFVGIEGAAFWGTIMVVLAVIPGIGTPLVWIPGIIYLYLQGEYLKGTLLLAWGAGVVGTIDNILRPLVVGKGANLPDILVLIGTLGGLFAFGAPGFIIGPIICALFLTVWEIYGVAFSGALTTEEEGEQEGDRAEAG